MRKSTRGFTIVELLIVIVVIAILVTISVVAYNGIQTRAKNTKTINATSAWIKALKLYHADKGSYPALATCLGNATTYTSSTQCWVGWSTNASFLTLMQPYMSSYPEPDTTNVSSADSKRGALFSTEGGGSIYMMLSDTSTCPAMGIRLQGQATQDGGIYCIYYFQ
jgi:prepilin-type N-terminal cleavage/methylation domain-containing protein